MAVEDFKKLSKRFKYPYMYIYTDTAWEQKIYQ